MLDAIDLARLTAAELREFAVHGLWRSLAGDPDARVLLKAIKEEDRRRGLNGFEEARVTVRGAVIEACERVERSVQFARARKLRTLLRMIVESTLESGEPIKQELLGRRLYGKEDFDRAALATQVRRLRKRLERYYQAPDIDDAIRFHIPKGQYIAVIRRLVSTDAPAFLKADSRARYPPGSPAAERPAGLLRIPDVFSERP